MGGDAKMLMKKDLSPLLEDVALPSGFANTRVKACFGPGPAQRRADNPLVRRSLTGWVVSDPGGSPATQARRGVIRVDNPMGQIYVGTCLWHLPQ